MRFIGGPTEPLLGSPVRLLPTGSWLDVTPVIWWA